MKKLSSLLLATAFLSAGVAQAAEYELGAGRLIFQGGLTKSGCLVDSSEGISGGANGDIIVPMPNNIPATLIKPISATTQAAFDGLSDYVKASSVAGAGANFTLSIICPKDAVITNIQDELGLTGITSTDFDTNGKLQFSSFGADQGGFVNSDAANVGVLAPSANSQAKNVGVTFLRTNPTTGNPYVVNLVPASASTGVTETLKWSEVTGTPLGAAVTALKADASYDFAYVSTTAGAVIVNGGGLEHITNFRFVYTN